MPESTPVSPETKQEEHASAGPMLMIGLGGSGANAAAYIKELVQKQCSSDESPVRFLSIDTD